MAGGTGVAREAAASTVGRHSIEIRWGDVQLTLPGADQLAFFVGIGTLAYLGIIEWPVAGILVAGHLLAQSRHNTMMREFGEALEQA